MRRSLRNLAGDLRRRGHAVGPTTVARLLREEDYGLKAPCKRLTGPATPTGTGSSARSPGGGASCGRAGP